MMNLLNPNQARALASLVAALRPDWGEAGLLKSLHAARELGTPWQIAHAALKAAEDPDNRTPAVIPLAGKHWEEARPLGSAPVRAKPCDVPGHNGDEAYCDDCAEAVPTPDEIARIRAETRTA